jgi:hypothetical protein
LEATTHEADMTQYFGNLKDGDTFTHFNCTFVKRRDRWAECLTSNSVYFVAGLEYEIGDSVVTTT